MSRATLFTTISLAGALFLTGIMPAQAADGRTTAGGPISAGPGTAYREVERLGAGLNVTIYGCLATWDWCDISWRGKRGWIAAGALAFDDAGDRVSMSAPHARMAVPVMVFHSQAYWEENYSSRVWYSARTLDQ